MPCLRRQVNSNNSAPFAGGLYMPTICFHPLTRCRWFFWFSLGCAWDVSHGEEQPGDKLSCSKSTYTSEVARVIQGLGIQIFRKLSQKAHIRVSHSHDSDAFDSLTCESSCTDKPEVRSRVSPSLDLQRAQVLPSFFDAYNLFLSQPRQCPTILHSAKLLCVVPARSYSRFLENESVFLPSPPLNRCCLFFGLRIQA